jgi:hypothetical protein
MKLHRSCGDASRALLFCLKCIKYLPAPLELSGRPPRGPFEKLVFFPAPVEGKGFRGSFYLHDFVEIVGLSIGVSLAAWARYGDELISDGASRTQAIPQILSIIRADLVTAILAGLGRTISEVGAVIPVGGNIRGVTRTTTTTIVLQTSQGELFRSSGVPACKQRGKPRRAV